MPAVFSRNPRACSRCSPRPGEVVSRDELRQQVWSEGTFVDSDRGLAFCAAEIRAALGDSADSPRFIETLTKRGFRFVAPVRPAQAPVESLGDANPTYTNERLSDGDREAILGTYAYGTGPTERLAVSVNSGGTPVSLRQGATERPLFHLGGRVFHRIPFAPGERAPSVSVEDGRLLVGARRP